MLQAYSPFKSRSHITH